MRGGALAALLLSGCTYMLDPRFFDLGSTDAGDLSGSVDTDAAPPICDPPPADIWQANLVPPSTAEWKPCAVIFHMQDNQPATLMRKLTTLPGKTLYIGGEFSLMCPGVTGSFSAGFFDDMGSFNMVGTGAVSGSLNNQATARRGQTSFYMTITVSKPCDVTITNPRGEVEQ